MEVKEVRELIKSKEYDFLRNEPHLGDNICLLTLGGSHAYGTNIEGSDVDIRGIALPQKREIILGSPFEQVENRETDTVIYSFGKIVDLLTGCNPNCIEMLGCKDYIYLSDVGKLLLDNKNLFVSKKCVSSFGGYANAQLRRLENMAVRSVNQQKQQEYILGSINNAKTSFPERFPVNNISLYIDKSTQEDYDTEIFMDINLAHYPLRDTLGMIGEMQGIMHSYSKLGMRNEKAKEHGKLGKHMMHLFRLYLMALDLLEKGEIITYREKDHDFLMSIRNGRFLDEDEKPTPEFYECLKDFEERFDYAKKHTSIPDKPNYKAIEDLKYSVYSNICKE